MEVCRVEITEADLAWLESRSGGEDSPSRSELARELCDRKALLDARGGRREVTGRVLLRRLERASRVSLPAPRSAIPRAQRSEGFDLPDGVVADGVEDLRDLHEIEVVPLSARDTLEHAQWVSLMESRHDLGRGPLCGAQIRYLVRCREGLLGALAFSACAWRLAARDRWIGWSERARRENLQLVVSNTRFLLVPRIPNLASYILSLATARLPSDFQARYGYRPLLVESFVDPSRFDGTCYRAANWQHLGSSTGRGRQDRERKATQGIKEVFVYPLDPECREKLSVEPLRSFERDEDWARVEFGAAELPDERLNQRLLVIARDFFARPTASISQACSNRAKTKAVYRFCEHEGVTMKAILAPHHESTLSRASKEKVVLAVQDTTSLNYTTHRATEDLGPIGSFGAQATLGLLAHSTLLFNTAGTPLGLLDVQCWARDPAEYGKHEERESQPIEGKESHKWLVGYEATAQAQRRLKDTKIVNVADREADLFELFALARSGEGRPELLVRACQPRKIQSTDPKAPYVWDSVKSLPSRGTLPLTVPRRGSRPRRETTLEVRFAEVCVKPPKRSGHKAPVTLWAIAAREESPPSQGEPIEWLLLTTLPVISLDEAAEKLAWYTLRWQIEVYHRTLKSGCRIENRQLASAHSLQACVAVDMVVAWRIFHLAKLGREIPDVPCSVFFEEAQWKALVCFLKKTPVAPAEPPTLRQAIHMTATLGGFLGRKSDGNPGTQTLWLGLQRLDDITAAFEIFAPRPINDTS